MLACTVFSALSQILLKQSANRQHASPLKEYLNWRVILAYLIFGTVLLVNTYAYTNVDLKYGPVLDTFTYVFVLLFFLAGAEGEDYKRKTDWKSHYCGRRIDLYDAVKK